MSQPKIKRLPDALINRIAAGEIIERPSSVIRELVENSLDADAHSIAVEIAVGGKQRIVVADDGAGMSAADVRMAVERHATSKIADGNDLSAIHTLGFRGEALGSIASVSRFYLFSRERAADAGTEIAVAGGALLHVRDAGVPAGTRVVVEDLFYSVPARRKFLKSDRTEHLSCYDVIVNHALSRPDVGFRLTADEKAVINAPAGTLRGRVGDVLGRRVAGQMGEVEYEAESIRVTGLVGGPGETRSTQSAVHLFVNDRPVRDFGLAAAVVRAYSGLIFGGRFPVAVLFIQLPFSAVDVNIHPAKREVKFADPRTVGGVVYRAVGEALRGLTTVSISGARPAAYASAGDRRPAAGAIREAMALWPAAGTGQPVPGPADTPGAPDTCPPGDRAAPLDAAGEVETTPSGMKQLGQVAGTYLALSDGKDLIIIDQHAAHERVVYERIKAGRARNAVARQRLLFPMTLDLDAPDRAAVAAHLTEINAIGFELEEFGGKTLLLSAVPSVVGEADARGLIAGIAEALREEGGRQGIEESIDSMIKAVACHGAVRAGQQLSAGQIDGLIGEIEKTPFAACCPHGRPTMIRITRQELERRFKRT